MKNSMHSPPKGLSTLAKAWWNKLTDEYGIDDQAGLLLLETAMRAMDRMTEAAALITKHGIVTEDRFGQLRPNPATTIERDSRAAMISALKALNLDLEPLGKPGRQPGK